MSKSRKVMKRQQAFDVEWENLKQFKLDEDTQDVPSTVCFLVVGINSDRIEVL